VYTNDAEYLLHYNEKHKSEENENEKQVIKWYLHVNCKALVLCLFFAAVTVP
jgi:hypothetical protein